MNDKCKMIIIIDDRMWKSIASDFITVMVGVVFMSVGYVFNSFVLDFAGLLSWCIFILGKSIQGNIDRKTIEEARKFLDEIER